VRTTFGGAAAEVESERPASRRASVVVAALVVLGGAGAAAFLLNRGPAAHELASPAPAVAPPPSTPIAAVPPTPTAAPARTPPPEERTPSAHAREPSSPPGRKVGARHAATAAAPSTAATAAEPAPAVEVAAPERRGPASAGPADLAGAWEGPWTDPAHNQKGRLFLQIAGGGGASGWLYNVSARQSYRMVGTLSPAGGLDLACQCPPNQSFFARGSLRVDAGGEVRGQLSLASAAGAFGETHLTLRRSAASR
jgi:hypothetical protein